MIKIEFKSLKWLFFILLIILSMFAGFYMSTAMAFPANPSTYVYFEKISNMPFKNTEGPQPSEVFWQDGGDCDDRALAFKEYLDDKGVTGVQICWVCRIENGKMVPCYNGAYGHVFLVWNNRVYNPTLNESHRFYNEDVESFKMFLRETYGFNTWYFENQTVGTPF